MTWGRTMVSDLKECGLIFETTRRQAEDRQQCRNLTEAPCATLGRHFWALSTRITLLPCKQDLTLDFLNAPCELDL